MSSVGFESSSSYCINIPFLVVWIRHRRLVLTAVTVGSVRIRAAVDGAAGIRGGCLLVASSGHQADDGCYDAQHQDQAGDADADREALLRNADAVVWRLQFERKLLTFLHIAILL